MMTRRAWADLGKAFQIERASWGEKEGMALVAIPTLEAIAMIGIEHGLEPAIILPEAGEVVLDLDAALNMPEFEGNKPASKVREVTGLDRRLLRARAR